jgi:hypothetical protein
MQRQLEADVRLLLGATLFVMVLPFGVYAQGAGWTCWVLSKNDGHTWCGYIDNAEFMSEAEKLVGRITARVTCSLGNTITEVAYQVEPESGDWIVIDKYTSSAGELALRRATLLPEPQLVIIQDAIIRGGKVEPFRLVSITKPGGEKVDGDVSTIDLPQVPVRTSLSAIPGMAVASEMRSKSMRSLCKKVQ